MLSNVFQYKTAGKHVPKKKKKLIMYVKKARQKLNENKIVSPVYRNHFLPVANDEILV